MVADEVIDRVSTAPRCGRPAVSPDGRHVAVVSDRGSSARVWLLPADGGAGRVLADEAATAVAWSPRGDALAYVWTDDGTQRLSVLTLSGGSNSRPCWSWAAACHA